ncbi:hypothetical protein DL98DRAFT_583121 [Cadophora sp. DSE1049]|nr:hypothetical protein DL98DRAFT_583121 [Cadophora sp. DSE1049]
MSVTVRPTFKAVTPVSTERTHTAVFVHDHDNVDEFSNEVLGLRSSNGKTLPQASPTFNWLFLSSLVLVRTKKETKMETKMETQTEGGMDEKPWYMRTGRKSSTNAGLRESMNTLKTAIMNESAYVTSKHVILCGVGRGCAAASRLLLSEGLEIGGFIGFGGWLAHPDDCLADVKSAIPRAVANNASPRTAKSPRRNRLTNGSDPQVSIEGEQLPLRGLPILIGQSSGDENVLKLSGKTLYTALIDKGATGGELREYDHNELSVKSREGIDDMIEFMKTIFPETLDQTEDQPDYQTVDELDSKVNAQTEDQTPRPPRIRCSIV